MTNKEKQEWLVVKYPLTIISDRYDGTYSGGGWLAFPLDYDEIPEDVNGDDLACVAFWEAYYGPVGKGNSAQSALDDLIKQMCEFEPEESEDERIINGMLAVFGDGRSGMWGGMKIKDIVTWLKKQKDIDKMIVVSPEVWDNAINEAFENGKKESEKQKEQKPAEWSEDDEEMRQGCIDSVEYELLDNGKDDEVKTDPRIIWLKSLPLNLKKKNEDVAKLCSNEWSEEAKEAKETIIAALTAANMTTDCKRQAKKWLQSLSPSWKPSEEQMEALNTLNCHGGLSYIGQQNLLISLYNDLKKLK